MLTRKKYTEEELATWNARPHHARGSEAAPHYYEDKDGNPICGCACSSCRRGTECNCRGCACNRIM